MNHSFAYVGCFIEFEELHAAIEKLRKEPLEVEIQEPHITFEYRPEKVDTSLFGTKIAFRIVGYGNNGQNEGLKVMIESDNSVLKSRIECIEVPHITLAISKKGKPVDTRFLEFEEVEPIELSGMYGGYTKDGHVVLRV